MARATAGFVIGRWEENVAVDVPGAKFVRTSIGKTFSGEIVGTSIAEATMAGGTGSWRAYVAFERFDVTIDGRTGGFVLLHDAWGDASGGSATWTVMPTSGTGGLEGITGKAEIARHDDGSHTFVLDYDLG